MAVEKEPTKDEIKRFWSGIWNKPAAYNKDAQWLNSLEKEYCKGATSKDYIMDYNRFKKVLYKMKNNGAPGNNLISFYWIKKLTSTHKPLVHQFNMVYEQNSTLSEWLVKVELYCYQKAMKLLKQKTTAQ